MGQKLTTDPYDYRYYVDATVLQKIKELVNNDSSSLVYANLISSVKVGADQTTQKTIEETKADIASETSTTVNTSIDLKKALDVLRFKEDESNPYYPKGENATPEAIAEFKAQYQNAQEIMAAHVGTDPHKITELPSRVVVAQKDYLLQSIKQARQEEVNAETEKLTSIQQNTLELRSQFETAKQALKDLQNLDPNTMTLDGQQEHTINLNEAQQKVTELRTQIYQNLADSKTARESIKETEKTLSKTDKQFKKSLVKAEKKIAKEERVTFKQMVKNFKNNIVNKIEERRTEKALEEILGKEESPAPQNEEAPQQPVEEKAETKENTTQPANEDKKLAENEKPVVLSAEETAAKEAAKATQQTTTTTKEKIDFKSMTDEQLRDYVTFNFDADKSHELGGIATGDLTGVPGSSIPTEIIPAAVEFLSRHPNIPSIELKNLHGIDLTITPESTPEMLAEQWQTTIDALHNQPKIEEDTQHVINENALTDALTAMGYSPEAAAEGASAAIAAAEMQKAQTPAQPQPEPPTGMEE